MSTTIKIGLRRLEAVTSSLQLACHWGASFRPACVLWDRLQLLYTKLNLDYLCPHSIITNILDHQETMLDLLRLSKPMNARTDSKKACAS